MPIVVRWGKNKISYNVLQPYDSWLLRRLAALDSQFCKGAVMRSLRFFKQDFQSEHGFLFFLHSGQKC